MIESKVSYLSLQFLLYYSENWLASKCSLRSGRSKRICQPREASRRPDPMNSNVVSSASPINVTTQESRLPKVLGKGHGCLLVIHSRRNLLILCINSAEMEISPLLKSPLPFCPPPHQHAKISVVWGHLQQLTPLPGTLFPRSLHEQLPLPIQLRFHLHRAAFPKQQFHSLSWFSFQQQTCLLTYTFMHILSAPHTHTFPTGLRR